MNKTDVGGEGGGNNSSPVNVRGLNRHLTTMKPKGTF